MTDQRVTKQSTGDAVRRMKIAVALACIRSKPKGITAQEHTEKLCAIYKEKQLKWKEKCEDAQTEILHLKQQLVLQSNNVVLENRMPEEEDVNCFSQNLFPTPPASGNIRNNETVHTSDKITSSLSKHTLFLSHMIALKNVSNSIDTGIDDLTKMSILNSLQLLEECIGKDYLSWRVQTECVECIVSLINRTDSSFKHVLAGKVCDLAKNIAEEIISTTAEQFIVQEQRTQVLVKLGSGSETSKPVIETLLNYVFKFSEYLRKRDMNGNDVDPDYFCSMYYVIKGLDQCISQTVFSDLNAEFRHQVNGKLEDCLLHVTVKFPIFAHAIWKICGKIL